MTGAFMKVVSADVAVAAIADASTLTVSAASGLGCPDAVLEALGRRFGREGAPRGLTTIHPLAAGDLYGIGGIDHIAKPGLLACVIGGSFPSGPSSVSEPAIWRMIRENEVAAYNIPAGVLFDLHREAAQTRLGRLTSVGLGTYADPRLDGCRMNEAAREDLVSVVEFRGRELLYYHPIAPDIAIVRATTSDERGNLSMEREGASLGVREQALAVRNLGGKVIAQVERLTRLGERRPHDIHVPGHLVDLVVVAPEQMQTTQTRYDPAICGESRRAPQDIEPLVWGIEKIVARRVARELVRGEVVNVGFGISANVPRVLLECGEHDSVTWVTEQGATGGLPLTGFQFGCALNPEAIVPWSVQFALLQGGGANRSLLSFLEADAEGNVNVTRLAACPHVTAGAGGFVDITTGTRDIVFSGRFDAGGGEIELVDGGLRVIRPGRVAKLVDRVSHVSFSGARALERGQRIALITERCVMRFDAGGWRLTEVAPGIDVRRDVLERIPFPLDVSRWEAMDPDLFRPECAASALARDEGTSQMPPGCRGDGARGADARRR